MNDRTSVILDRAAGWSAARSVVSRGLHPPIFWLCRRPAPWRCRGRRRHLRSGGV